MKVSFSPAAQADLLDIAAFIAQDNPPRALTFVDELESKCNALGGAPGIGKLRPELDAQMERVKQPRKATLEKVSAAMGLGLEQLRW